MTDVCQLHRKPVIMVHYLYINVNIRKQTNQPTNNNVNTDRNQCPPLATAVQARNMVSVKE